MNIKGLYEEHLLPRLMHRTMRNKELTRLRSEILPSATGRVLEVGLGSGLNLPFYGSDVKSVTGIDPSRRLLSIAGKEAEHVPFECNLVPGTADQLPYDDKRFDTVVTTWSLCSIANVEAALGEMRRVLKPGGALLFIEHGRSPDHAVQAWQNRLNGVWGICSGGCNLNRGIETLIQDAGFAIQGLDTGYMVSGPRFLTYFYRGRASRSV